MSTDVHNSSSTNSPIRSQGRTIVDVLPQQVSSRAAVAALRALQAKLSQLEDEKERLLKNQKKTQQQVRDEMDELQRRFEKKLQKKAVEKEEVQEELKRSQDQSQELMDKVAKSRQIFEDLRDKVLTTTRASDALAQKLESVQREAESLRKELKEAQEKQEKFIEREVKNNERLLRLQVEHMDKEQRLQDKVEAMRNSAARREKNDEIESLPQRQSSNDLHRTVKPDSPSPDLASSRTSLIYEKETSLDDLSRELEEEKERRRRLESQCLKIENLFKKASTSGVKTSKEKKIASVKKRFSVKKDKAIKQVHGAKKKCSIVKTKKIAPSLAKLASSQRLNRPKASITLPRVSSSKRVKNIDRVVRPQISIRSRENSSRVACKASSKRLTRPQSARTTRQGARLTDRLKGTYVKHQVPFMVTGPGASHSLTSNVQTYISTSPSPVNRDISRSPSPISRRRLRNRIQDLQEHIQLLTDHSSELLDGLSDKKSDKGGSQVFDVLNKISEATSLLDELQSQYKHLKKRSSSASPGPYSSPNAKRCYDKKVRMMEFLENYKKDLFGIEDGSENKVG